MKITVLVNGPLGNLWDIPQETMTDALIEAHHWSAEGKNARTHDRVEEMLAYKEKWEPRSIARKALEATCQK